MPHSGNSIQNPYRAKNAACIGHMAAVMVRVECPMTEHLIFILSSLPCPTCQLPPRGMRTASSVLSLKLCQVHLCHSQHWCFPTGPRPLITHIPALSAPRRARDDHVRSAGAMLTPWNGMNGASPVHLGQHREICTSMCKNTLEQQTTEKTPAGESQEGR